MIVNAKHWFDILLIKVQGAASCAFDEREQPLFYFRTTTLAFEQYSKREGDAARLFGVEGRVAGHGETSELGDESCGLLKAACGGVREKNGAGAEEKKRLR